MFSIASTDVRNRSQQCCADCGVLVLPGCGVWLGTTVHDDSRWVNWSHQFYCEPCSYDHVIMRVLE